MGDGRWQQRTSKPHKSGDLVTATHEVNHHTRCMCDPNCAKQRPFVCGCGLTDTILESRFDCSGPEAPCGWDDSKRRQGFVTYGGGGQAVFLNSYF
jgi:hypothetical protein